MPWLASSSGSALTIMVTMASKPSQNSAAPAPNLRAAQPVSRPQVQAALPESATLPPPEKFKTFNSTRVAQAAYDRETERLYVLFHKPFPGGTVWTYDGIQANVWKNMQRVQSVGKFINRVIDPITHGHPGQW